MATILLTRSQNDPGLEIGLLATHSFVPRRRSASPSTNLVFTPGE